MHRVTGLGFLENIFIVEFGGSQASSPSLLLVWFGLTVVVAGSLLLVPMPMLLGFWVLKLNSGFDLIPVLGDHWHALHGHESICRGVFLYVIGMFTWSSPAIYP